MSHLLALEQQRFDVFVFVMITADWLDKLIEMQLHNFHFCKLDDIVTIVFKHNQHYLVVFRLTSDFLMYDFGTWCRQLSTVVCQWPLYYICFLLYGHRKKHKAHTKESHYECLIRKTLPLSLVMPSSAN